MNIAERRRRTEVKLRQRERLLDDFGPCNGQWWSKQREKVEKSVGYMKNGHVSHFVGVKTSKWKTKITDHRRWSGPHWKRKFYGSKYHYPVHDARQVGRMDEDLQNYYHGMD